LSYVIFTFTFNKNLVKGNVNNLIGKIAIIKKYQEIDSFYLANILNIKGIDILNIIVIYYTSILEKINYIKIKKPFTVKYLVD